MLLAVGACGADEVFPVVHNEPIAVRVVDGKGGRPVAHAHVVLVAGYDQHDLRLGLWREEALADDEGMVRLSRGLKNLPWLQVEVAKRHLCKGDAERAAFSVERIRRDGLSAANRCGTATVENAPGVVTVFVKGKKAAPKASSPAAGRTSPAGPVSAPAASSVLSVAPALAPGATTATVQAATPEPDPGPVSAFVPGSAAAAAPAPEPAPTPFGAPAPGEDGLEPVINFAPVNPMESARLSQSDWDSGGNSECIPCHISRAPRFTRVLSIRATHAAPQS